MIVVGGLGSLAGSRLSGMKDLLLPGDAREIGEQWVFGRGSRDDFEALADTAAADGIRSAAPLRQAKLERLAAEFVVGEHAAALDDARTVLPDVELFEDQTCRDLMLIVEGKVDRLRFQDLAQIEDEMRAYFRSSIETILAFPVGQWRTLLAAKFAEIAIEAHEVALGDVLRDVGPEHPTCSSALALSRFQVVRERFLS